MLDIIGVGECLVDCLAVPREGFVAVEGNAGGAPANVLAMAAKAGLKTALVSRVGDDVFGEYLRRTVRAAGVDDRFIAVDEKYPTTLAVVSLDEAGGRSFGFYRTKTADVMLSPDDIPVEEIKGCQILHFGSVSLTDEPSRSATLSAVQAAKKSGVTVSCDPNLRPLLWQSSEEAREWITKALELSDLVKISDDELLFLTDEEDMEKGIHLLWQKHKFKLLCVTRGKKGCVCKTADGLYASAAYAVETIDTTGAGDAFWGAMLCKYLNNADINECLDYANAAGSLSTAKKGAIPSYPSGEEIEAILRGGVREI